MRKIIILEDLEDQAQHLMQMLGRYGKNHPDFTCTVQHYASPLLFLAEYSCDADLIFLDIQMPDMLGIDVARKIRQKDEHVMIIFVTMLTQYAIEGYEVRAFDYVLKPVRYEEFAAKMDRVCRILSHQSTELTLELRTKEDVRRISADDILYLEVSNHDILIHTGTETFRQWGSLKSYEEQLQKSHFVRCNACYLVNLKYVRGIVKDTVQVHDDSLPISKSKRKEFLAALAQYKGGSR